MSLGIGVLGCGSVFAGPYAAMIDRLASHGRVHVAAVYDVDERKREGAARRYAVDPSLAGPEGVIGHDDVDVVLVLTSMNEHGALTRAGLEAGKHVLVEKPLATSLDEGEELVALAAQSPGLLVCAPHVVLSPTFRAIHECVGRGEIGRLLSARARYGWAGPWWGEWFYRAGGGSLFDLGVYNVTTLCALFGPARRVTAMVGTAIPEREVNGRPLRVEADDNAHVLLDFGEARYAVVTTGFTMQRYRSPAVELYGSEGTAQLLGDDWAPEGWELWTNAEGCWRLMPETDPHWQWTDGLRHLVDCVESGRPTTSRPEHALHALEIMLAAQAAGADGVARELRTAFPPVVLDQGLIDAEEAHRSHDRRSHGGL